MIANAAIFLFGAPSNQSIANRVTLAVSRYHFSNMPGHHRRESSVQWAELNGKELDGRALNVNEARPKEGRGGGGYRGRSGGGASRQNNRW